jgi:hypothetical protein
MGRRNLSKLMQRNFENSFKREEKKAFASFSELRRFYRAKEKSPVWSLGIDPGFNGAFVLTNGRDFHFRKMPVFEELDKRSINFLQVRGVLIELDDICRGAPVMVFLERALPFAMGSKSAFNYGRGYAAIENAIFDLDLLMREVEPARWTKAIYGGEKSDLKAKAKSRAVAEEYFPKVVSGFPIQRGLPHDGLVDALLIAAYGLRVLSWISVPSREIWKGRRSRGEEYVTRFVDVQERFLELVKVKVHKSDDIVDF